MDNFASLFLQDIPLIDVRAPVEFQEGHFPSSVNLCLMNDDERKQVGTCYKEVGQAQALALGHALVQGDLRAARTKAWTDFKQKNTNALLYCFRGGLRSEISTLWMRENGANIEFIPGGYKALRRYLIEILEKRALSQNFYLIAGRTGSGKTEVLRRAPMPALDLEFRAHHKGSSFGGLGDQPAQISFENSVAVDLLKIDEHRAVLIEDEAVMIGKIIVPRSLFQSMRQAPRIVLERPMDERVKIIAKEYVMDKTRAFDNDFGQTFQFLASALNRIQKKLGGLQHQKIMAELSSAFASREVDRLERHGVWIESLLTHYYDPLYDRGLELVAGQVVFKGDEASCLQWAAERNELT